MAVLGPLSSLLFSSGHLLFFSGFSIKCRQITWELLKFAGKTPVVVQRILNVNGDGCDRKKIAGRRIRRELKIRESEKLEDDNHNNSLCN